MYVHFPKKNGMYRYWSIANYEIWGTLNHHIFIHISFMSPSQWFGKGLKNSTLMSVQRGGLRNQHPRQCYGSYGGWSSQHHEGDSWQLFIMGYVLGISHLVGGFNQPLWKIWKSVGMIIPNIWKKNGWNHQPVMNGSIWLQLSIMAHFFCLPWETIWLWVKSLVTKSVPWVNWMFDLIPIPSGNLT